MSAGTAEAGTSVKGRRKRFNYLYYLYVNSRKVDTILVKDPNLDDEKVKSILQSFSALDENGDGKISKRELARGYRLAGFNPTNEDLDELMREHDANDDGYIDFGEYFDVMRTKVINLDLEKERMKTAFRVLDADDDGYITTKELKKALSISGNEFTEEEIDDLMRKADKNNDGRIDYDEFVEAELCATIF